MSMRTGKLGVGLDIGGTKIMAALGTEDGQIWKEVQLPTDKTLVGFIGQLDELIRHLILEAEAAGLGRPQGVGIGLPGRVTESIVEWVPNLPELNGVDLGSHAETSWGMRLRLQNDGQLALYGEQWQGAARGSGNVLMLTLGTGIGGAIMVDGKLLRGAHGTAGSMGWITMDLNDEGDPELGWLERMASGTAVNRQSMELSPSMDSRKLFELAERGHSEAEALIERIGFRIGGAIANLASVIDPELVLIGGGLSRQLPVLLPSIRSAQERFGSPTARRVPINAATLMERAGMWGALRLSMD